ncbi:MAG: type II secretion system minor pseudopilin GspH [Candidatus Polarisedimenticolaceae bacterium]|nr:type II secretion system minor pseudopilin GspH [Candidatus Polarisedimenticolaceae bacterium]
MTTSPLPRQKGQWQKGFTLVELMVVIVIMSIMLGFLVVSIGGGERDKPLQDEAKRISALIKLATEQSMLQSMEIGLLIDEGSYRFLTLHEESWSPLSENNFRQRKLPGSIQLELVTIEHLPPPEQLEKRVPQILLLSSGEMTPFELEIRGDDIDYYFSLTGSAMGKLTLQQVEY